MSMLISMIVAIGAERQLGLHGQIPWHLKGDLQYFKAVTMGRHIMMGRTTFLGLPKVLPGRKILVVSHIPLEGPLPEGCQVFGNLEDAVTFAQQVGEKELIVAGGQRIYEQMLPRCQKLYLTKVDYHGPADAYFPEYEKFAWHITKGPMAGGPDDAYPWQTWILERQS
ncbi:MAG: dihydrofolate reductase [Bacteriovoracaceae bacterium]|nr:dihydrofolate reductase [Bacteriovoracaceae bacterium]